MALFNDFKEVSKSEWEAKITKDLKGKDFEETLLWKTQEGINVYPHFHKEDLNNINKEVVDAKNRTNEWLIRQDFKSVGNKSILLAIMNGVNSIGINPKSSNELNKLLKEIKLEFLECSLTNQYSIEALSYYIEFASTNVSEKYKLNGTFEWDPIGTYSTEGKWLSEINDIQKALDISEKYENLRILNISGDIYSNAGGNAIQDLAFTLAHLNQYIELAKENNIDTEKLMVKTQVTLAVGANYFFEMAKIKAFKSCLETILNAYQISSRPKLHCKPANINQAVYDRHNNLLRNTTQAMSAIIAGCDSLSIPCFDDNNNEENDFALRIARNIQLLLKEESYLDKVNDPAAGSYYIENITKEISEKSWELFQKVEGNGGYLASLKNDFVQNELKGSREKLIKDFESEDLIILGVNRYPNAKEDKVDFKSIAQKEKQDINPIPEFRLAEKMELERSKA